MDVHDLVGVFGFHFVEHGVPGDACIIDQNIHPAESGFDGLERGMNGFLIGYVAGYGQDPLAVGIQGQSSGFCLLLVQIQQGYACGVILQEPFHDGITDASGCAGDDCVSSG